MTNLKTASFGKFLKQEREKMGWTQTDFGAKIGINMTAISKIENNTKQFTAKKLAVLSELFGIELTKIKELYFADKFAKEAYKYDCPETVFNMAEENIKYLKSKNTKQGNLNFE
jgi:transcriptional regulator with XRE-family HTH domain